MKYNFAIYRFHWRSFSFSTLNISIYCLLSIVFSERSANLRDPVYGFSFAVFWILFLSSDSLITTFWCMDLFWVQTTWSFLLFWDVEISVFHQICEVSSHYFFKKIFMFPSLSFLPLRIFLCVCWYSWCGCTGFWGYLNYSSFFFYLFLILEINSFFSLLKTAGEPL